MDTMEKILSQIHIRLSLFKDNIGIYKIIFLTFLVESSTYTRYKSSLGGNVDEKGVGNV